MLFQPKLADDIFDNDHRAVDDEPEIDRAQAHQIPGYAETRHAGDGKEKCERDRSRDNQRRAPVAEKEQQHRHDEQGAFAKICCDGVDRSMHEVLPVVLRLNDYVGR